MEYSISFLLLLCQIATNSGLKQHRSIVQFWWSEVYSGSQETHSRLKSVSRAALLKALGQSISFPFIAFRYCLHSLAHSPVLL